MQNALLIINNIIALFLKKSIGWFEFLCYNFLKRGATVIKYRNHKIIKENNLYFCRELNLKSPSIERLIEKINKKQGYSPANLKSNIDGKNGTLFLQMDPLDSEIIFSGLKKIKEERGLSNRAEVLKFLIELYEIK